MSLLLMSNAGCITELLSFSPPFIVVLLLTIGGGAFMLAGSAHGQTGDAGPNARPQEAGPSETADTAAIRQTALDYIEGWYTGNAARMERAVHPKLVKRIVALNPESGKQVFQNQGADQLIKATEQGHGTKIPEGQRQKDVTILDVFANAASVKIVSAQWIDYLHLAKWKGEWKIVNVLWELKPKYKPTAQSGESR
jgi:hypothetical protein